MRASLCAASLLFVVSAHAQLPNLATATGTYNVRYLGVNTAASNSTMSFSGTMIFDGNGGFTVSGQGASVSGSLFYRPSGTYSVSASGLVVVTNPFDPSGAASFRGGIGSNGVMIGSSSSSPICDLFVAVPQGSSAGNQTLNGTYNVASLEFLGGDLLASRDALFTVFSDGNGNLGNVQVQGTAVSLNSPGVTQVSTGVTYSVAASGSGSMTFPAPAGVASSDVLVSGSKLLAVSPDGDIFIAGSSSGYDMVIGLKAPPASQSGSLRGLYFTAILSNINPAQPVAGGGIHAASGAAVEHPTGSINDVEVDDLLGNFTGPSSDVVYSNTLSFNSDGTVVSPLHTYYVMSPSGDMALSAAAGKSDFFLRFWVQAPAMTGSGMFLNPQGVVNSASNAPFTAHHSPGELITLYGTGLAVTDATASAPFPATLADVQVMVSGGGAAVAAPVYSVCASCNPNQISAVIPYGVTPDSTGHISFQVVRNGTASNLVSGNLGDTSPGVFTIPAGGTGNGAIEHANGSLVNSASPARPGETVAIYLTGLGAVNGAVSAGGIAPVSPLATVVHPVSAYIGGQQATVTYAGLAPGLAGLYQLNVTIPQGVGPGNLAMEILTNAQGVMAADVNNSVATIPVGQ